MKLLSERKRIFIMKWSKPELICVNTEELLCKVKAKANSSGFVEFPSDYCNTMDNSRNNQGDNGDSGSGGGGMDFGECGVSILAQCITVGPLFGCNDDNYCSTLVPVFR